MFVSDLRHFLDLPDDLPRPDPHQERLSTERRATADLHERDHIAPDVTFPVASAHAGPCRREVTELIKMGRAA